MFVNSFNGMEHLIDHLPSRPSDKIASQISCHNDNAESQLEVSMNAKMSNRFHRQANDRTSMRDFTSRNVEHLPNHLVTLRYSKCWECICLPVFGWVNFGKTAMSVP